MYCPLQVFSGTASESSTSAFAKKASYAAASNPNGPYALDRCLRATGNRRAFFSVASSLA